MPSDRPPQVLPDAILREEAHRGRPVVVAGPPAALGEDASLVDETVVVGDGGYTSTFYRGFTTTTLTGTAGEWDLPVDRELWGPRDGWVSFSTEHSFLGGPDSPEAVLARVRTVADHLAELEATATTR